MPLLSPQQETAILESIERGTPPQRAFRANGVSSETLRRWRLIAEGTDIWPGTDAPVDAETKERIVTLVQRIADAQARCFEVVVGSLYHNATTRSEKTGWYDTQAADKLLSKHPDFRKDWHEERHLEVTNTGTVAVEHSLARSLDDDALASLEQQLQALPPGAEG